MRFSESQDFYSKNVCAKLFAIYNPLYFNDDKKKSAQKVFVKIFFPFFPIEKKKQRNTCFWLKDFFLLLFHKITRKNIQKKNLFLFIEFRASFLLSKIVCLLVVFLFVSKIVETQRNNFFFVKKKNLGKKRSLVVARDVRNIWKKNYNRKKSDPHENYEWRAQSIDTMSNLILKKLWLSLLSFSMKNM